MLDEVGYKAGQRVECDAARVSAEQVLAAIVERHDGGSQRLKAYQWALTHLEGKGWHWRNGRFVPQR